jgi:hypothetical protein
MQLLGLVLLQHLLVLPLQELALAALLGPPC